MWDACHDTFFRDLDGVERLYEISRSRNMLRTFNKLSFLLFGHMRMEAVSCVGWLRMLYAKFIHRAEKTGVEMAESCGRLDEVYEDISRAFAEPKPSFSLGGESDGRCLFYYSSRPIEDVTAVCLRAEPVQHSTMKR